MLFTKVLIPSTYISVKNPHPRNLNYFLTIIVFILFTLCTYKKVILLVYFLSLTFYHTVLKNYRRD